MNKGFLAISAAFVFGVTMVGCATKGDLAKMQAQEQQTNLKAEQALKASQEANETAMKSSQASDQKADEALRAARQAGDAAKMAEERAQAAEARVAAAEDKAQAAEMKADQMKAEQAARADQAKEDALFTKSMRK